MNIRLAATLTVIILACSIYACEPESECPEIDSAIQELESPNTLAVRDAIRNIGSAEDPRCAIQGAPALAAVLADGSGRHDLITRGLAAESLAAMAKSQSDMETADPALSPLVENMLGSPNDTIRAQCALALGRAGYAEKEEALRVAALADDSLMVRAAAEQALRSMGVDAPALASAMYSPSLLNAEAEETGTPAEDGVILQGPAVSGGDVYAALDDGSLCLPRETNDWMKKHLIMLDGKGIDIPVCESR